MQPHMHPQSLQLHWHPRHLSGPPGDVAASTVSHSTSLAAWHHRHLSGGELCRPPHARPPRLHSLASPTSQRRGAVAASTRSTSAAALVGITDISAAGSCGSLHALNLAGCTGITDISAVGSCRGAVAASTRSTSPAALASRTAQRRGAVAACIRELDLRGCTRWHRRHLSGGELWQPSHAQPLLLRWYHRHLSGGELWQPSHAQPLRVQSVHCHSSGGEPLQPHIRLCCFAFQ